MNKNTQENDLESTILRMGSVELDKEFAQENLKGVITLSKMQLVYSIVGMGVGLACVLSGGYLSLNGYSNNSKWLITAMDLKSEISDAGPGVILFVVGVLIIYTSRFRVKVK